MLLHSVGLRFKTWFLASILVVCVLSWTGCGVVGTSRASQGTTKGLTISQITVSSLTSTSAVIKWTTDTPSSSQVEYGITSSYGSKSTLDSNKVTSHSQSVSGLAAGTIYHYRVHSIDASGQEAISADATFATSQAGGAGTSGTGSLIISNVTAGTITSTSAVISWTTSAPASSRVEYGTGTSYGSSTTLDSMLVTSHAQTLTGLAAGTAYHFRVRSADGNGNEVISPDATFITTGAGAADADFAARCADPNVVNCYSFDFPIGQGEYTNPGLDPSATGDYSNIQIDPTIKASGTGALHFTLPSIASGNGSGEFHMDFSPTLSPSFGEGQEFFVQWRQRFDDPYLTNRYLIGTGCTAGASTPQLTPSDCPGDDYYGGIKQFIIGPQDTDLNPSSQIGKHFSCETPHIVATTEGYNQAPVMYHSCGVYEPFEPSYIRSDGSGGYLSEGALPCDFRAMNVPNGSAPPPPCARYFSNQWMTLQLHVKVGRWYMTRDANFHRDSIVELWLAPEGQPSVLVQSQVMYDLHNDAVSTWLQPGAPYNYGKVWFLPYITNRDPNAGPYPVANTWYDELIVSTRRVPDPLANTPNPPDSLVANAVSSTQVDLSWRRNTNVNGNPDESGFKIERCPGQIYDCNAGSLGKYSWTQIATATAGVTTYSDTTATAGQIYSYRVRAYNTNGDSAYTSSAVNLPAPASDLVLSAVSSTSVKLSWTDNSMDETEFAIERCQGLYEYYKQDGTTGQSLYSDKCLNTTLENGGVETNSYVEIGRLPAVPGAGNTVTFTDSGLNAGTTYSYRVRALNAAGSPRAWNSGGALSYTAKVNITTPN